MQKPMTVLPYVGTSLTQFYNINCSVVESNYTSVIATPQTAKPPSYLQLLPSSTSIRLQNRITESYILPTTQVQSISPEQELQVRPNDSSKDRKPSITKILGLQYLQTLLQFVGKLLESPLPIVFGTTIVLVVIAMLISLQSGGIKVDLHLQVSTINNQIEIPAVIKR